jgi:predicted CXXCH cytochrome family protein
MRTKTILLASLFLILPAPALAQAPAAAPNSCLDCHLKLDGELKAPAVQYAQDAHAQFGLTCRDCHGGNPAAADEDKAKDKTFKGAPKRAQIPEFCGRCHADATYMRTANAKLRIDQLDQYWTSQHGRQLKKGDTKVAVCTDCHGNHGILSAKFPKSSIFPWNVAATCGRCHGDAEYMKAYKIPTNQPAEWKESVHAKALLEKKDMSAPTCNDCHGNHGAYPPEVKSVASVCRQCHPSTGDLFNKSAHKKAFDDMGASECEACHGNHKIQPPTNAMLGTADQSVCITCHDKGSAGFKAAEELKGLLDVVDGRIAAARGLLDAAEKKGVEVSEPQFKLKDIDTATIMAKNLVHGLNVADIKGKLAESEPTLVEVEKAGNAALGEAKYRRSGLIIATALLALFGVALYLKIRTMKKPE